MKSRRLMRLFCQTQTKTKTSGINPPVRYILLFHRNYGGRAGHVGSGLVLGLSPESLRGSDLRTKAEFDGYLGGSFCYATSSLENHRL
jgi:hypothetical protein